MFWCCQQASATSVPIVLHSLFSTFDTPAQDSDTFTALMDGNQRLVAGTTINQDVQPDLDTMLCGENPTTTVLGCADLPLHDELIFDAKPGFILGLRTVGNTFAQTEDSIVGSLEHNVKHMKTKLIVVLGHIGCRAIETSCKMYGGQCKCSGTTNLFPHLMDTVMQAESELPVDCTLEDLATLTAKVNVAQTMDRLLESSGLLRSKVRQGQLRLEGGLFDPSTGVVQSLGPPPNQKSILGPSSRSSLETMAPEQGTDVRSSSSEESWSG